MCVCIGQERIPVEEVFEQLKCTKGGLSGEEGEKRLQIFGPNKLEEKKDRKLLKFLGFMWNPLSWVMECAAIMAIALANGGVTHNPHFSFFSLFLND